MGGKTRKSSERAASSTLSQRLEKLDKLWSSFSGAGKEKKLPYILYTLLGVVLLGSLFILLTKGISFLLIGFLFLALFGVLALQTKQPNIFLIPLVVLIGVVIRIQNLPLLKGKYPLALDPFVFLRYARELAETGSIAATDALRYVPLGFDTTQELLTVSYVSNGLYTIMKPLIPNITIELAHILYPVIFFSLGLILFYLIAKELFNYKVAVLSSLILAVFPSYLYRTMAGFSDKEPVGIFLMFLSIYLLVLTFKQTKDSMVIILAALSGIAAGLMGLAWGGVSFLFMIVGAYAFTLIFLGKMRRKEVFTFTSWVVVATVMVSFLTPRHGGLLGVATSLNFALPILAMGFVVIHYLLRPAVIRLYNKFLVKYRKTGALHAPSTVKDLPISPHLLVMLLFVVAAIGAVLVIGPERLLGLIIDIKEQLLHPLGTGRLTVTVAENRQPYFADWWSQFGYFFYFFFIGSMYLFYRLVSHTKNYKWLLTGSYILFITLFIFSRNRQGTLFNGITPFAAFLFFGSITGFILFFFGTMLYSYFQKPELFKVFSKIKKSYLFTLVWFVIMILAARGAMRLFFIFSPIISIVAGYFLVDIFFRSFKLSDRIYKITAIVIILLLTVPTIFGFWQTSYNQAKYTGPSFNDQWQVAMDWVSENTDEDAVFAHWWDYGYWVQAEGHRATILDGGNVISYWNHLMGRHVLSGRTDTEALEFLKVHDGTHLLIISDEIGKYTAYSSIGSDEEFDIFSWIGTFVMEPRATREKDGSTHYTYYGVSALDEDFTYKGKTFPANKAAIGQIQIPIAYAEDDPDEFTIEQPVATIYYQNDQQEIPIECLFFEEEQLYFDEPGLEGCIRLMPRYINYQYQQENGALLWVSRKGFSTLWTRLFLFNEESDHFKLVYDDSQASRLAYYNGRILGPLKIWEIQYPENLSITPKLEELYLNKTTNYWKYLNEINRKSPYVQE